RARRTDAGFLPGQLTDRWRNRFLIRLTLEVLRLERGCTGKSRESAGVRCFEIKCGCQIANDGAAPWCDVVFDQFWIILRESSLEEPDERGVVEQLRVDPAAPGPRRDHNHRHANAEAIRAAGMPGVTGENLVRDRNRR